MAKLVTLVLLAFLAIPALADTDEGDQPAEQAEANHLGGCKKCKAKYLADSNRMDDSLAAQKQKIKGLAGETGKVDNKDSGSTEGNK